MTPEEYETLVADICTHVTTGLLNGRGMTVQKRAKLKGKSGQVHEIDVVVNVELAQIRFLTLIECKLWKDPVGLAEVMVLKQRIDDIGANKGVVVSASGFQQGALTFAKANGIALVICTPRRTERNYQVFDEYRNRSKRDRSVSGDQFGVLFPFKSITKALEIADLVYLSFPSRFYYLLETDDVFLAMPLPLLCNPMELYLQNRALNPGLSAFGAFVAWPRRNHMIYMAVTGRSKM